MISETEKQNEQCNQYPGQHQSENITEQRIGEQVFEETAVMLDSDAPSIIVFRRMPVGREGFAVAGWLGAVATIMMRFRIGMRRMVGMGVRHGGKLLGLNG